MKAVLMSLAVVLMFSINTYAAGWIIVPGAKVDGDLVCLDRDDVVMDKGVISAWLKRIKENDSSTKSFYEFDCSKKKTKLVKSIELDGKTNTTTTVDHNEPAWEAVTPGTLAGSAFDMVCKKGKGKNPALVSLKVKE
jgi:hypothetical protein